jgi:hypothetical protein
MALEGTVKLHDLDAAIKELLIEIEHQFRASRNNFFGNVKLELTYNWGNLSLVRVSSERTVKTEPEKQSDKAKSRQG